MMQSPPELNESGLKALTATSMLILAWLRWGDKLAKILVPLVSTWCSILSAVETWRWKRRNKKELRMGGTYGTKETCEIIAFGLGLASAVQQAKANDGVIDTKDLPLLLPVIPTVLPAIENISAVPAELGELDEEDLATVQAFVLAKLPAVGEQWTTIATNALVAGLAIYRIIKAL